jgi:hypothetical protein
VKGVDRRLVEQDLKLSQTGAAAVRHGCVEASHEHTWRLSAMANPTYATLYTLEGAGNDRHPHAHTRRDMERFWPQRRMLAGDFDAEKNATSKKNGEPM